jgi:hypothetical protein
MRYHSVSDEERIVKSLRKQGLIRSPRFKMFRRVFQAAAVAAVLIATFMMGAQYGRRAVTTETIPVVKPVRDDHLAPSQLTSSDIVTEDPSALDDYRDEPDRPDNGGTLFAKTLE